MSKAQRDKGARIERELVNLHETMGIHAERYPLSGASRFRGEGHDIDVYAFGVDETPLVAESKARGKGDGFRLLERWLADFDMLFLRRDGDKPLVVLPWETYNEIMTELARWERARRDIKLQETLTKLKGGGNEARTAKASPRKA
jgi:Holliday junction resolvase